MHWSVVPGLYSSSSSSRFHLSRLLAERYAGYTERHAFVGSWIKSFPLAPLILL